MTEGQPGQSPIQPGSVQKRINKNIKTYYEDRRYRGARKT